ncbi:unnamed protein product [Heligmosomoides polygyrus]|uniref:VWFA domain-containing protein n=1 Tax=Heligmosomoides polygyrus TaxID=6339 RepID=A0A3P8B7Q7_HELPZ|nr:unnamed protein product [Heligmosomoides polygyrus]
MRIACSGSHIFLSLCHVVATSKFFPVTLTSNYCYNRFTHRRISHSLTLVVITRRRQRISSTIEFNVGMPTTPVPPAPAQPTQDVSVPCQLSALNYDVYLVVDTSAAISSGDFLQMKQMLVDFVNPFVIGDGKTQFALVATAIDSELYGTGFHNQQDRTNVINTINTLTQDDSTGQTLKLSLQAIENNFLSKNYSTSNKVIVYVTGTTSWDTDPVQTMKQLAQKYGAKPVAVQWTSGASTSSLTSLTGGSACVNPFSSRASSATWLQTKMCRSFCM